MIELFLSLSMGLLGLGAIALTLVGLPGTWTFLAFALVAQWLVPALSSDSAPYSWWIIAIGLVLCVLAEIAEGVSGAAGAAKAGASKRALLGAALGGIVGAILGTLFIPVPLVGTIVGGAAGASVFAVVFELSKKNELRTPQDLRHIAKGAAIGRLLSTVIKSLFCVVLVVLFVIASAV